MSWKIANLCADRIFGSAARKQIIMFLADKASDDGSGIWCSKGTIQRHTELGESTVKRTISDFLREGILIESGRRPCKNGFTVIYRIALDRVMTLESSAEPDEGTGSTVDPVQRDPGRGSRVDGVPGPRWTPNHPETIHKPPTRKRAEAAVDERVEKIWSAYPKDRQRGKAASVSAIAEALTEGIDPDDLLRAVQAYATESAGFTRSKVCFLRQLVRQPPLAALPRSGGRGARGPNNAGRRSSRTSGRLGARPQPDVQTHHRPAGDGAGGGRAGDRWPASRGGFGGMSGASSARCAAHRVPCIPDFGPRSVSRVLCAAPFASRPLRHVRCPVLCASRFPHRVPCTPSNQANPPKRTPSP